VLIGAVPGENRGAGAMNPPVAHVDPYYWLRDDTRSSPEVLAHLAAENAYTSYQTSHLGGGVERLYKEMLARVKETDAGVPYTWGGYRCVRALGASACNAVWGPRPRHLRRRG
jgi:oligopeptidase B